MVRLASSIETRRYKMASAIGLAIRATQSRPVVRCRRFRLPASFPVVERVDHFVRRFARRNGMTEDNLIRFSLAVAEATTNAVQHGRQPGRIQFLFLAVGFSGLRHFSCSIDNAPRLNRARPALPRTQQIRRPLTLSTAPRGRGRRIIYQMVDGFLAIHVRARGHECRQVVLTLDQIDP
ncbi:MAG: ATP-binding protein [Candidatus Kerfeldbacteria bacterium]|nr:ATP-binding protein [Candidatus Kerfeldbacteria bacterium]